MTLDEAVELQDALEAIAEGCTREDYVNMHNPGFRGTAGFAYDAAQNEIWTFGAARKALNHVKEVIDTYR